MSSVPQGVFAATKVHSNNAKHQNWENTMSMIGNKKYIPNPTYNQVNTHNLDHPLTKYNSKLMNSIWGMYNRYSVHNLKKNTEGGCVIPGKQQLYAAATPASLGLGLTGGLQDSSIAIQARDVLWNNSHTY